MGVDEAMMRNQARDGREGKRTDESWQTGASDEGMRGEIEED